MLTTLGTQLLLWDIWYKFLRAVSTRVARSEMARNLPSMARRLLAIVHTYSGMHIQFDARLRTEPPAQTVVCANHQSVADIAMLITALPNHAVRFVAKRELSRGFPAVSEVLRTQRHALIDRHGNPRTVARELKRLSGQVPSGITPVIFPEGTRSRTGEVGAFQTAGVRTLLLGKPVPITAVAVDGGYRLASMQQLRDAGPDDHYRAKMVGVFDHDGTKGGIVKALESARTAIVRQVEHWRASDTARQGNQ